MNVRAFIALFMGLLLQWSQVQAFPDASPVKSCGMETSSMACCGSKKACPCLVDQDDSTRKPAPIAPSAPDLKPAFIHFPADGMVEESVAVRAAVQVSPGLRYFTITGFLGVPLSVAFCSFII